MDFTMRLESWPACLPQPSLSRNICRWRRRTSGSTSPPPAILSHCSNRHTDHAFAELNSLRKEERLCDVVLKVGTKRILAHKIVLCACSPYFKAMFTGELAESRQMEVTMKDIDELALDALINFCYTSRIDVEEVNVQLLLPAACLLQMSEIQNICCEYLQWQLDTSNCLGIRDFADIHSCCELRSIADKFIRYNFKEVIVGEEFLLLPLSQLLHIISSNVLNVFNEEEVFDAIILWVKGNVAERKQHLCKALQHVRLHLIDPKTLVKKIGSDLLVRSDESCRDLVEKAKNYHLLSEERPVLKGPRIRPRILSRRSRRFQPKSFYSGGSLVQ